MENISLRDVWRFPVACMARAVRLFMGNRFTFCLCVKLRHSTRWGISTNELRHLPSFLRAFKLVIHSQLIILVNVQFTRMFY